jgi:hypothetical protein
MDTPSVGRLPQSTLQFIHDQLEGLIEVGRTSLGPNNGTTGAAGYLDVLAAVFLAPVLLVVQLDIGSDDLVVIAFDSGKFVGDVLPKMLRDFDVAASNNDLDQSFASFHATSTGTRGEQPLADHAADISKAAPSGLRTPACLQVVITLDRLGWHR